MLLIGLHRWLVSSTQAYPTHRYLACLFRPMTSIIIFNAAAFYLVGLGIPLSLSLSYFYLLFAPYFLSDAFTSYRLAIISFLIAAVIAVLEKHFMF